MIKILQINQVKQQVLLKSQTSFLSQPTLFIKFLFTHSKPIYFNLFISKLFILQAFTLLYFFIHFQLYLYSFQPKYFTLNFIYLIFFTWFIISIKLFYSPYYRFILFLNPFYHFCRFFQNHFHPICHFYSFYSFYLFSPFSLINPFYPFTYFKNFFQISFFSNLIIIFAYQLIFLKTFSYP